MAKDQCNDRGRVRKPVKLDGRSLWLASLGGCALLVSGVAESVAQFLAGLRQGRIVSTD